MTQESKTKDIRGTRICVTGAAGYLGSHVVKGLLERGYRVRATVRDPDNKDSCGHLENLVPDPAFPLRLVRADVMNPGDHDEAIAGCDLVCHMASPVKLFAKDPQREIVDVAVKGTENVLESVARAGGVRRVVLTSSIAAVYSDGMARDYLFSEKDWNVTADLSHTPYLLSKTLAEKTAWSMQHSLPESTRYELLTINPSVVYGPLLARRHGKSSPVTVLHMLKRKMPASPRLNFGAVDVREVAQAHLQALERQSIQGRYIVHADNLWMQDMARILAKEFPQYPVPTGRLPDLAVYGVALFDKRLSFSFLRHNLGKEKMVDNRRSIQDLGIAYRPVSETILDTARSYMEYGLV